MMSGAGRISIEPATPCPLQSHACLSVSGLGSLAFLLRSPPVRPADSPVSPSPNP